MRKNRWIAILSMTALMTMGSAMTALAGWSQQNNVWYYYNDSNGNMVRDEWVQSNGLWYYMDHDGKMQANRMIEDSYYVNEAGVMVTNAWVYMRDRWSDDYVWRYFGSNGKAYTDGWKTIGDARYHFTDSIMDTGWFHDGDSTYYLGSSGAMATGWKWLTGEHDDWEESWYSFGSNGKMDRGGEDKVGGDYYFFDEDGRMLTGWVNPSDYSSSGREDLSTDDVNRLKYYKSDGRRADGWAWIYSPDEEDEYWYYFDDGRAYSASNETTQVGPYGLAKIKGETYCFDRRGRMKTGLVEIDDGRKYYFDPDDGRMRTGRITINDEDHDNETFYFTTTGTLGNKGDGHTGVKDGYLYDGGMLVTAEEGMKYEKVTVDGKNYVVNERGNVKTSGTVTDADGVKYKIEKGENGGYKITVTG